MKHQKLREVDVLVGGLPTERSLSVEAASCKILTGEPFGVCTEHSTPGPPTTQIRPLAVPANKKRAALESQIEDDSS